MCFRREIFGLGLLGGDFHDLAVSPYDKGPATAFVILNDAPNRIAQGLERLSV
jgi:hypothetical protein